MLWSLISFRSLVSRMTQVRCPRILLAQQGIRHQIARRTAIQPCPCVASLANVSGPLTLGLTSLHPHAIVPSILSDEGQRIVLPAFFQRGRDSPDRTRQTFATAHRFGPTTPTRAGRLADASVDPTEARRFPV